MVEALALVGAGIAVGLAGLGAGIGIASVGAASVGGIAEKPDLFGKTMVYVAFAEAVAIYGLLVALMIILGMAG
jgi:V/A-type H+-transporting ATPase subunit K